MNNKGYLPPLAFALLILLIIFIIATVMPGIKETILSILNAIFK